MYTHTSSAFTSISSRETRRADLPGRQLRSARPGLLLSGLLALFGLAACGGVDDDTPSGSLVIPDIEWQLVFEDEFDGDSLDTSKWNIDTGDGCPDLCGWGNNEKQVYSEDNITVSGGVLTIQGRQEADGTYTSARINSKGKFDFQYGKVEVKARLPAGQGTWPAIWMLHSDPTIYGPWPLSGEIDIMEAFNLGVDGNTSIRSSTHYGLPTQPPEGTTAAYGPAGFSPDMNSYVYTLEWERDKLRFYVDGEHWQSQRGSEWYVYYPAADAGLFETDLYDEYSPYQLGGRDSPFDQLFHLVINLAIGGNPVGDPDPSVFPQNFEIDYVRVYECANANPDTGRGCGTADPSVVPLSDNDGNPLEKETTAQPYRESLPLFTDGPETLSITVGDQTSTNTLEVGGFRGDGATVINDPAFVDPDDPENIVWHVAVSGGVANAYLESEDKTDDPLLETGFDFSGNRRGDVGGYPVGEVAFDMQVNSIEEGTDLIFKLQSEYPNLGQVILPPSELVIGEWRSYSVKFDMFLANPFPEGSGVDLANVLLPFVIEVQNGSADVYLDNIRATNACQVVGACGVDLQATLPDVVVYDDAVNTEVWTRGIVASDSGTGFTDYTDPDNPANKVNWREIASDEPERGNVIEVRFNDSDEFGVWFIGSSATDLSAYSAGAVKFDLKVLDYGNNTEGMTFKIDCGFPCSSGDQPLGFIADGVWETVTFPVALLLRPPADPNLDPLDLKKVNTGIVLFPTTQSGDIVFQVDDIRWIAETDALPLEQIDLPVTFDDPLVDYTVIDFGVPVSASTELGEDPDDAGNTVAITTKPTGAPVWAGTTIGNPDFANPIPFTADATSMSVDVRVPVAGIPVMLKVETADCPTDGSDPTCFAELDAFPMMADTWETLTWDFVGIDTAKTFVKASIFFDFGTEGNDAVYYWDNVRFGAPPPPDIELSNPGFETGDFTDWTVGGGTNTVGAPGVGARSGAFAAQLTTPGGSTVANVVPEIRQTFAANPGDEVNFSVWMLTEAPLPEGASFGLAKIVFFDVAGNALVPASASIGVINTDFPGIESQPFLDAASPVNTWIFSEAQGVAPAGTTEVAFLLLNVDFAGGENPIWFDDAQASTAGVGPPVVLDPIDLPVTFNDPMVDYTVIDFGEPVSASTVLGEDPDAAGNTVAITTKPTGAPLWAGTTIGNPDFANPIPFTAEATSMSVDVRVPAAGIPIRLKVETADCPTDGSDVTCFAELDAFPMMADTWETLTWDFSLVGIDTTQTFVRASIFFDFGTDGNDAVYLWDNVRLGGAASPPPDAIALANGGFETGDFTGWTVGAGNDTVGTPVVGARSDAFAAQLTTTGGAGVADISQSFAANPGDEINLSAWMLTEAALPEGASFGLVKIVFKDAAGNELVPASASIGVINTDFPGIESQPFLNSASSVDTWVFSQAQGVAPAGTAEVQFLLLNVDFAGGENPVWFDDAQAIFFGAGP